MVARELPCSGFSAGGGPDLVKRWFLTKHNPYIVDGNRQAAGGIIPPPSADLFQELEITYRLALIALRRALNHPQRRKDVKTLKRIPSANPGFEDGVSSIVSPKGHGNTPPSPPPLGGVSVVAVLLDSSGSGVSAPTLTVACLSQPGKREGESRVTVTASEAVVLAGKNWGKGSSQ